MSEDNDYLERAEAAEMAEDAREELRSAFDEALALLKEFQFQTDSASIPVCGDCGASEGLCAADCRLAAFLKKWS